MPQYRQEGSIRPPPAGRPRRAVFLDRDGTLVQPHHYPSRPAHLRLYDGIGPELWRLQAAGFQLIVITNQSGLARGYFTEADLQHMHEHLAGQLERFSLRLDGIYHCPHHVDGTVPHLAVPCDCRKPAPGMLLRAAVDLSLDLCRSWFVGDILDDVEAGNRAGCRTVLVDLGTEGHPADSFRQPDFVARDTVHALRIIQRVEGLPPLPTAPSGPGSEDVDLTYRPPAWSPTAFAPVGGERDAPD